MQEWVQLRPVQPDPDQNWYFTRLDLGSTGYTEKPYLMHLTSLYISGPACQMGRITELGALNELSVQGTIPSVLSSVLV